MNSINNSNLNFTAKMDVSGIRFNKARWKKIANVFENETKNIPDQEIHIYNRTAGSYSPRAIDVSSSSYGASMSLDMDADMAKKFQELPDSKIIAKLKKLAKINVKNDKILKAHDNFCDHLNKNILDEYESDLSIMAYRSVTENAWNLLSKDNILKNFSLDGHL